MYTAGFYVILFTMCKTITWPKVVDLVLVRTPTCVCGGEGCCVEAGETNNARAGRVY